MKNKIQNFWYYYKYYVLGGIFLCLLIGNQIYVQGKKVKPDYQIAFVTKEYISMNIREGLSGTLEGLCEDVNQDGIVHVEIYWYGYDADTKKTGNPNEFMAAAVQLAADLKEEESIWYITDCPDMLTEADRNLAYGTDWENVEILQGIEADLLVGHTVLVRKPEGKDLLRKCIFSRQAVSK